METINKVGGIILVCIGIGLIVYQFKMYKEVDKLEKPIQKILTLVFEIASGREAALGLILIICGFIAMFAQVSLKDILF